MLKKNIIGVVLITVGFYCLSGTAKEIKVTKDFGNFTGISLNCNADLYLEQGDKNSVIFECEMDVLEKINTEVRDGVLHIEMNMTGKALARPFKVNIVMKDIDSIVINKGKINADRISSDDKIEIKCSVSSYLKINNLDVKDLAIWVSDKGKAEILSGKADKGQIIVNSYGMLYSKNFIINNASGISVSSYGEATINISNEIKGSLSVNSHGQVNLYGVTPDKKYLFLNKIKRFIGAGGGKLNLM